MAGPQEVELHITAAEEAKEANSLEVTATIRPTNQPTINRRKRYKLWFRIGLYSLFVLSGQSVATFLGSLYYDKGGKSIWMGTLVQLVGFPILLPYYFFNPSAKNPNIGNNNLHDSNQASSLKLAFVYVSIGLLVALDCYLYSVGLWHLPVSTYSLITSSQLAFNAFFSFFLNSLEFTFFIINSLILLTISSVLLVFHTSSEESGKNPKKKYVIGFICTVAASAGYGLVLSVTQLAFKKVMKKETFKVVMDMIVYQSLVATLAILVGLFASGEWKDLKAEMEEYEMGKASYVLNLCWTAISWQVFTIGCVGLIFEVSSLFSNAISVFAVPFAPIFAVIFFHEKMNGIKAISLVLAVWGFVSYLYQQYLDDGKSISADNRNEGGVSEGLALEEEYR